MVRRTVVIAGVAAVAGLLGCCNADPPASNAEPPETVSSAKAVRPARCQRVGREESVGQKSGDDGNLDKVLPFATETGEGVAFQAGFAVGALRQEGEGTSAILVVANRDGSVWRSLPLGRSHGDADAPQVFARGGTLGVALLDPSGASRTLRLAKIDRDQVLWGAEYLQGDDESQGYDVTLGERVGVAVWDDVPKDRKVSAIHRAVFDKKTFESSGHPRVLTLPGTDAEMPRVLERPRGFWLLWLARRPAAGAWDARYRAEDIAYRWLEAVPLDADGELSGAPVKLGSDTGRVLAYDAATMPDGSAVVVWRDDDTPSGSSGGQLLRVHLRLGGVDGPDPVEGESRGVGAPSVMPGWFAIADASGATRLAPMNADGTLVDRLAGEALFGAGEPLASHQNLLLVSRPDGIAVRLFVTRCRRDVFHVDTPDAGIMGIGTTDASTSDASSESPSGGQR